MKGNEFIMYENYAEIIVKSSKYGIIKTLIDIDDLDKCSKITWYYEYNKDSFYIAGRLEGKRVKLHRFIMDIKDSSILIDHKNRDSLDNRKSNLRICDYQTNSFNRSIRKDNTSGVAGVDYKKNNNKWRAKIKYNGVTIHLGYFTNLNDAIINRRIAEEYLFGEYSPNGNLYYINEDKLEYLKYDLIKRINKKVA